MNNRPLTARQESDSCAEQLADIEQQLAEVEREFGAKPLATVAERTKYVIALLRGRP